MRPRQIQLWIALPLIGVSVADGVNAQLAITEVMSATRESTNTAFRGPDYWELTNFGGENVDLNGYGFRDGDATRSLRKEPFTNLVIRAGESVIFFWIENPGQSVTNVSQFRAWWGDSQLPAGLRCQVWSPSPGLSGWDGDAVWLFDPSSNVVDHVQFGRARVGRAFTYEPGTGLFGGFSAVGVDGAFAAEQAADVGSPGTTIGPVPVRLLQEPLDQTADAGMTVNLAVVAAGLPRPRYQWFAHGLPLASGTSATLVLSNVQPADAGAYHVWISNGLSTATSRVATLTVNTNPAAPTVVRPPADATIFPGQTAVFSVMARGLPAPRYQWQANGVDIENAVQPTLELVNVSEAMSGTHYSARLWNELGSTNTSALLTVSRRPDLRFTEVMALPANEEDNRHFDWFEVTNFHTNAVNLLGWRFSDHSAFARAFTITNAFTLQPGESVVFAERLDARLFGRWWGTESLPEGLKLITYDSFGLGAFGDTLFLWNPAATDPYDYVATASWAAATPGVSLECEHSCDGEACVDEGTTESVPGWRGAFRAVDGGDIGSPGYVVNPPLRVLSVTREVAGGLMLRCRVRAGGRYRLWRTPSLLLPGWTPLALHTATNNVLTLADIVPQTGSAWFYRVEEIP